MIPCIRHDFSAEDWQAVCRIFIKEYTYLRYFPIKLNSGFMIAAIFGEKCLTRGILFSSFVNYLLADDVDILKSGIAKDTLYAEGDGEDAEILEILTSLNSRQIPKSDRDLQTILYEIGNKEIVQKPSYVREAWEPIFKKSPIVVDLDSLLAQDQDQDQEKASTNRLFSLLWR